VQAGRSVRNEGRVTIVDGVDDLRGNGVDDVVQIFDKTVEVPEGRGGRSLDHRHGVDGRWKGGAVNSEQPRQSPIMVLMIVPSALEMQVAR